LVGKPKENGSFGRPKQIQKDNITVSVNKYNTGVSWTVLLKDGNK